MQIMWWLAIIQKCNPNKLVNKVVMEVQESTQTRIAGVTTCRYPYLSLKVACIMHHAQRLTQFYKLGNDRAVYSEEMQVKWQNSHHTNLPTKHNQPKHHIHPCKINHSTIIKISATALTKLSQSKRKGVGQLNGKIYLGHVAGMFRGKKPLIKTSLGKNSEEPK